MKKICVLGGSGFVGTRLISLLKGSYQVVNIDLVESDIHSDCTLIGDVRDSSSFEDSVAGSDTIVLLAAEHRDDVTPKSLYYEVNVEGIREVLRVMDINGVKNLIFTSSVAVYGLNSARGHDETSIPSPFNDYGKSKLQAESVAEEWVTRGEGRNLLIIRPSVIFGERNRGNVYNLLRQIYTGRFIMIGKGLNHKSMAYVGNVVGFIAYMLKSGFSGAKIYNYADKPDFNMNALVAEIYRNRGKPAPKLRIPLFFGILCGYLFDLLSKITGRRLTLSSIRVRKFCASTEINSAKLECSGFKAPFDFKESLQLTLDHEFGRKS